MKSSMMTKDKHLKLDQTKIEKAKKILKSRSETETVEKALDLVIARNAQTVQKKEIFERILSRKEKMTTLKGEVSDLIKEGRAERDKTYGG